MCVCVCGAWCSAIKTKSRCSSLPFAVVSVVVVVVGVVVVVVIAPAVCAFAHKRN